MILGINASRARSGGARAHLIGLLSEADPAAHGFSQVHVWSYRKLLDALPDRPWLMRHSAQALERGLLWQVLWERFSLPGAFRKARCDVLLNVDAGTVSRVTPSVTMSRDMLSYEPGEIDRYEGSAWKRRLLTLRFIQNRSLRAAQGAIFLTRYAGEMIERSCGRLRNVAFVPHGVGEAFRHDGPLRPWPADGSRPVECLYISPIWRFKHQWHVVTAIAALRAKGHDLRLMLAGDGEEDMIARLHAEMARVDPEGEFITHLGHIDHSKLPELTANADLYVFASSCENMPNTLLEGMAGGLPIACSNRGPMPEVIEDGAVLFDPEDPQSIAAAIETILTDDTLRARIAARAKELASQYSWRRCARETLAFLAQTVQGARSCCAGSSPFPRPTCVLIPSTGRLPARAIADRTIAAPMCRRTARLRLGRTACRSSTCPPPATSRCGTTRAAT
jgi:glycosyltransferase involved in cell wall biosynthesis